MKKIHNSSSESPISIGELAKKMGITVRTLQYYDKQGLLIPSATTTGGRRFYTKQDLVKLHQILSLKYLGFSLDDIKKQIVSLHKSQDVIHTLELQCQLFQDQIKKLNQVLSDTEILLQEVKQMHHVDLDRYANIVVLLRQKSDSYWLFKVFSNELFRHVNESFSQDPEAWARLYLRWKSACDETIRLEQLGEPPEGPKAQLLAREWWDMTLEFTGGDLSLMEEMKKFEENCEGWDEEMKKKVSLVKDYRTKLLKLYLRR